MNKKSRSTNSNSTKQDKRHTRRKLLTALAAAPFASKLPDAWSRPVVASVMLPAHAAGSPARCASANLTLVDLVGGGGFQTVYVVGSAYGLMNGSAYSAQFIYPGGNRTVQLGSVAPNIYAATLNPGATVPDANFCDSPFTVNFFPAGSPGNVVCGDTLTICSTVTVTMTASGV